MPRLGFETGVGMRVDEPDLTPGYTADGRRRGFGCARPITAEEKVLVKRNGVLKCPGPQDLECHQLVNDDVPGQWFMPIDPGLSMYGACGNHMQDLRTGQRGQPLKRQEFYCPTCHFSILLAAR